VGVFASALTVVPAQAEPVAEALPVLEPTPEPEPVVEPEPEPEPAAQAITSVEADSEPEPEPEPPALVVVPEPERQSEPEPEPEHRPEFSVVSEPEPAAPLPDYVVNEPDGPPPVVVPDPEPEPELGPLPDFVVEPGGAPEAPPPPPVESALDPEEEEDLGPLPDFVIDPSLPPELRPAPPPPRPASVTPPPVPSLRVPTSAKPEATTSNASLAGIYFPPTTAFPVRRDDDEAPTQRRQPSRPRPNAEPENNEAGKKKRSTEPAEPGDETTEVGWMAGLSGRLSAYSLADEDAGSGADESGDAGDGEKPAETTDD
jgi:hypothetical protein